MRSLGAAYSRGYRVGKKQPPGQTPGNVCSGLRPYHGGKRATRLNDAMHQGVADAMRGKPATLPTE
jgi:hypothetical protein